MSRWKPQDDMELGRDYFHCTKCDTDRPNEQLSSDEDVCVDCATNVPEEDDGCILDDSKQA